MREPPYSRRRRELAKHRLMTTSLRRGTLAVAAAALVIGVAAPSAFASPGVCNQATPHWLGGGLVALDPPVNSPAARYTVDIGKLPGNGGGLFTAAAMSPSLTVCDGGNTDPTAGVTVIDGGTTVPVDDGIVSAG
jgi:hypothetical protein